MKGILSSDYNGVKTKTNSEALFIKKLIYILSCVGLGVVLSNCTLFNVYSPFVTAFCCAVSFPFSLSVACGAIFSSIIGFSAIGLKGVVAIAIVVLIKWAMLPLKKYSSKIFLNMLCGFSITVACYIAFKGIENFNYSTVIFAFGDGIICLVAIYFFNYFAKAINKTSNYKSLKAITNLDIKEKAGLAFTFLIICMFLQSISIGSINICNIIFCGIILYFSLYTGFSGGCFSGVLCGAIIAICNPAAMFLTACYGFSGMICGIFKNFGKSLVSIIFLLSNLILLGITQNAETAIYPLFEILFGICLFLVVPKKVFPSQLAESLVFGNKDIDEKTAFLISSDDLNTKANAFKEASIITKKLCDKMQKHSLKEDIQVLYKVSDYLCKDCHKCDYCWQGGYADTAQAFNNAQKTIENIGKINKTDFPQNFLIRCHKADSFVSITNFIYKEFFIKNTTRKQLETLKQSVWGSLSSFSEVLENSSKEIGSYESIDKKITEKILNVLNSHYDCTVKLNAYAIKDKYGRIFIKIKGLKNEIDKNDFPIEKFEKELNINFDKPFFEENKEEITVSLREQAKYSCESFTTSLCFEEEKYCGDNWLNLNLSDGRDVFSISDGMGKGTNAAIDSAFCTKILSILLNGNFNIPSAMNVLNSSLMGKNIAETVTTLDVSEIDLYTGYCNFYKAGACQSIVVKNGKPIIIEGKSMPMGLCDKNLYFNQDIKLSDGDLIIMFSDGMTGQSGNCDKIIPLIKSLKDFSCEKVAKILADYAKNKEHNQDDITVSVVRIKKVA